MKGREFLFLSKSFTFFNCKIKKACDGKDSCELDASNDVYGNPCAVVSSKYIHVKYKCSS